MRERVLLLEVVPFHRSPRKVVYVCVSISSFHFSCVHRVLSRVVGGSNAGVHGCVQGLDIVNASPAAWIFVTLLAMKLFVSFSGLVLDYQRVRVLSLETTFFGVV